MIESRNKERTLWFHPGIVLYSEKYRNTDPWDETAAGGDPAATDESKLSVGV